MTQSLKVSLDASGLALVAYPYGTSISTLDPSFVKMSIDSFYDFLFNDGKNQDTIVAEYQLEAYPVSTEGLVDLATGKAGKVKSISDSVVQIDMSGNVLTSEANATVSTSKEECKDLLGGVEKINDQMVLVADSANNRVYISIVDTGKIIWEYKSDRNIVDARMIKPSNEIAITDSVLQYTNFFVTGQEIVFKNDCSNNIKIYSGQTTKALFDLEPDLSQYGSLFTSPELSSGERFSYKFGTDGTYYWFAYPNIQTGTINSISNVNFGNFVIIESDTLDSTYSSKAVKLDTYGNVIWEFGPGYEVNPKDVRVSLDKIILSV